MIVIAPLFAIWSIYGIVMFVALNNGAVDDDSTCSSASQRNESYAFLIFWFILSFVLIFSYICLVFYGYSQIKRSASVKKSTL